MIEKPANPSREETSTLFDTLQRFVRRPKPSEQCELCSAELTPEHAHLVEPATRHILCSCDACAILFSDRVDGRYRRVPRDARFLQDFVLTASQWDALHIPINLAFFFRSSRANRVIALYPSPAGPVESQLALEAWAELLYANPVLASMRADVEGLLVNRLGTARFSGSDCYLAPIDQCYKLVGLVRSNWRGLSGGTEVWREIRAFFEQLRAGASIVREDVHA